MIFINHNFLKEYEKWSTVDVVTHLSSVHSREKWSTVELVAHQSKYPLTAYWSTVDVVTHLFTHEISGPQWTW